MDSLEIQLSIPEKCMISDIFSKNLHFEESRHWMATLHSEIHFPSRCPKTIMCPAQQPSQETFDCVRSSRFKRYFEGILPVLNQFLGCTFGIGPERGIAKEAFEQNNAKRPPVVRSASRGVYQSAVALYFSCRRTSGAM
jgi:hypothetical protein